MATSQKEGMAHSHFHWVFPITQHSSCCKYVGFRVWISGKCLLKCEPDKKCQERPLINIREKGAQPSVQPGLGVVLEDDPFFSTPTSLKNSREQGRRWVRKRGKHRPHSQLSTATPAGIYLCRRLHRSRSGVLHLHCGWSGLYTRIQQRLYPPLRSPRILQTQGGK